MNARWQTVRNTALGAGLLLFAGSLSFTPAQAATRTWDGSENGLWSDTRNWQEKLIPINGDLIVFPVGAINKANTNDIPGLAAGGIRIDDEGYVLRGMELHLQNGIRTEHTNDRSTITLDIVLDANQTFHCAQRRGELVLEGKVNLQHHTLTIQSDSTVHVNGQLSGPGGIVKTGDRDCVLFSSNSYDGQTTIAEGQLLILADKALGSTISGTVVEDGGALLLGAPFVAGEILSLSGHGRPGTLNGALGNLSGIISHVTFTGNITLQDEVYISVSEFGGAASSLTLSGAIDGPGSLQKRLEGTLILSGDTGNTYAGETYVRNGVLEVGKTSGNAVPADLRVGQHSGNPARVRNLGNTQVERDAVIETTGSYDLNGFYEGIRDLTLYGGSDITGHPGRLSIWRSLTVDPDGTIDAASDFDVELHFGFGGTSTIHVVNEPAGGGEGVEAWFLRRVSGDTDLIKTGSGSLSLLASNSFTGSFTLEQGFLWVEHNHALGATGGVVTCTGESNFFLNDVEIAGKTLTMNSLGTPGFPALSTGDGISSWSGPINLLMDTTADIPGVLTLSGVLSGPGGINWRFGGGTLWITGPDANTNTGLTTIATGTLVLDKDNLAKAITGPLHLESNLRIEGHSEISSTIALTMTSSAFFDLNNHIEAIGSIAGGGRIDLGSGGIWVGTDMTDTTFDGRIEGTGELHKFGSGRLRLTGDNTYSGLTRVGSGILQIDGNQPASEVMVDALGTLAGRGTTGDVESDGAVSPGTSPGHLLTGAVELRSGSQLTMELTGPNPVLEQDRVVVEGKIVLLSPTLNLVLNYLPARGDRSILVDNDGHEPIAGTFDGLPDDTEFMIDTTTYRIDYDEGTGNDIVLTVVDVKPKKDLYIHAVEQREDMVHLQWTGGIPRYAIQHINALGKTNTWGHAAAAGYANAAEVPGSPERGYYRVIGGQ